MFNQQGLLKIEKLYKIQELDDKPRFSWKIAISKAYSSLRSMYKIRCIISRKVQFNFLVKPVLQRAVR